jgi:hypothetical protein
MSLWIHWMVARARGWLATSRSALASRLSKPRAQTRASLEVLSRQTFPRGIGRDRSVRAARPDLRFVSLCG